MPCGMHANGIRLAMAGFIAMAFAAASAVAIGVVGWGVLVPDAEAEPTVDLAPDRDAEPAAEEPVFVLDLPSGRFGLSVMEDFRDFETCAGVGRCFIFVGTSHLAAISGDVGEELEVSTGGGV